MSKIINWEELPVIQDNGLPPRAYYSLEDAANILKCSQKDVLHYAATDRLEVVAYTGSLEVYCSLGNDYVISDEDKIEDQAPETLDFFYIYPFMARDLEIIGKAEVSFSSGGYSLDYPFGIEEYFPWGENQRRFGLYRFYQPGSDDDEDYKIENITVTPDAVYVMAPTLSRFKKGEPASPFAPAYPAAQIEHQQRNRKTHGNAERHAAKREAVLKAAIYCKSTWPEQCGSTNREWAKVIDEKAALFWPETATPPMSLDSIERMLGASLKLPGNVE